MRAFEILNEASIFSRGTYTFGHQVKLSSGSAPGQETIAAIIRVIPDFDPSEKLTWVKPQNPKKTKLIIVGRGDNTRYFSRPNGEFIAFRGADSHMEKFLNHADKYNRGDIAEGILGAALSAKLIKRGLDKIGSISEDDIRTVLSKAITAADALIYTVEDKNSLIADKVSFTLRLPSGSMDAIKNKKLWERFNDLFQSATAYVNSSDTDRYSNYFYKNGKVDEILIESDGVSGQKDRKTDVKAVVNTTDPKTGEVISRTLKNIDISLKADSPKYGQSSAGGLTKSSDVWFTKSKEAFEPFGITLEMPKKKTSDMLNFYLEIYKQVAKKLNDALSGKSADKETNFIEKVADVIMKHGSGDNPNLRLISFQKGAYSLHSFNLVKRQLIKNNIDLAAKLTIGPRSGKPSIEIYDVASGELLTAIRYYLTEKASTNYFEQGPLLYKLSQIVKQRKETPSTDQPPQSVSQNVNQKTTKTPIDQDINTTI
jgi:hypothetical protein